MRWRTNGASRWTTQWLEVRACRHPDAQWLVSLFPVGADASRDRMEEVMLEQMKHDARAGSFAWLCGRGVDTLARFAEMGYGVAQGRLALLLGEDDAKALEWSMKAAGQNDRNGVYRLGVALHGGYGCSVDHCKRSRTDSMVGRGPTRGRRIRVGARRVRGARLGTVHVVGTRGTPWSQQSIDF
jgi:hypothetical protein